MMTEGERERRLHEVARAISSSLDLPAVLTSVVRQAAELVDAQGGALALVTSDGQWITYPYLFNLPPGLRLHPTPRGQGLAWYCVETGESMRLEDYSRHARALPRWAEAGVHAFMCVPVVAGEERIGALGLFGLDPDRHFSRRDLALAESIGLQSGVAIQNARRFEATRRQLDELLVLDAVARAATEETAEDALIGRAVKEITSILHPEQFCLFLLDEAAGLLRPHRASCCPGAERGLVIALGEGLAGRVASDGVPRRIPEERLEEGTDAAQPSDHEMCVPMKIGDRLIGVIQARRGGWLPYTENDLRLLTTFAGQLATALDRLRAEAALRESEGRFRRLAENARDVIYRLRASESPSFEYVSPAVTTASGYSPAELYGESALMNQIIHPEDRALFEEMTRATPGVPFTTRWIHKDGRVVYMEHRHVPVFDANGKLVAVEGIARDVTERMQLEDQLRQSQKMEAIGRLAGGVAHDFNNLLTVILNYSDQQLRRLEPGHPLSKAAEEIKRAGERAAALTRQLLAFSRKQVIEPRDIDLNGVLSQLESMLRSLVAENINLRFEKTADLGLVRVDPGQIEQVIVNLLVNARDSMPKGGRLQVRTSNVRVEATSNHLRGVVEPGRYVMLAISDTGTGMDEETRSHLFEPFFTTKEKGKGTGLGLSTVYGIVQQSRGKIRVESEWGRGTTVEVYLPRVEEVSEAAPPSPPHPEPPRVAETVLLVEDEPALRSIVREILEMSGYRVLEAAGGEEAMAVSARHAGRIHLMVTDVVMPGMSGRELAERLAAARPGMRVLYTSGHTDDSIIHHGVLAEGTPFLQKPFNLESLARKVREVLDAPSP